MAAAVFFAGLLATVFLVAFFFVDAFFATFGAFVFALVFFFKRDVTGSPVVFLLAFREATDFTAADFPVDDLDVESEVDDAALVVVLSARGSPGLDFSGPDFSGTDFRSTFFAVRRFLALLFSPADFTAGDSTVNVFVDFRLEVALAASDDLASDFRRGFFPERAWVAPVFRSLSAAGEALETASFWGLSSQKN